MTEPARCERCGRAIPPDAPGGACPHCAFAGAAPAAAPPTAEEVAAKLPAFEILGVLGSGGMGVVFKARQKALDRIVALKVLPPATAATPGFAERFQREAKAMARLAHPNIVAVHDFGESGGLYYLVLEFVDGLNVREAMAAGRIRPGEALSIVPQICDALQYAHDRGVVHRDIKPENVMIDKEGRVRIADFGLAKLADRDAGDPTLTGAGQVMGTLRYMAPEQWERPKEVDHRADIYSLGVVFYEMLTGEVPAGRFEPPSKRAAVDMRLDEIVMRAVERDRERRWQHASEVKTKVGEIASGAAAPPPPSAAAPPPPIPPTPPMPPAKPSLLPVVVPLLVTVLFGVVAIVLTGVSSVAVQIFWWLAGLTFFGAIVTAVVRWDRARRGVDDLSKSRLAFALEVAKDAIDEPEPKGRWMSARTTAMVTLGGIAAAVVVCGGFDTGPSGMAFKGVAFILGLVLWQLCDQRKKAVFEAENGQREHPGPAVAIEILSAVLIVLGVVGVGSAAFGKHEESSVELGEGTKATFGVGGISVTHHDAPKKAPAADKAPWEFDVTATSGEAPPKTAMDEQRQAIWRQWCRAQALQSSDWGPSFSKFYDADTVSTINEMNNEARRQSASEGLLGLPLFPREKAALGKFRIESAKLGGWDAGRVQFETAHVRATDGEATLTFTMRRYGPDWVFAAAPVELE